jgi:hypothetical protein
MSQRPAGDWHVNSYGASDGTHESLCRQGMGDYVQIATMVRNEADNLAEWIAFHQVVGVRGFLIYDIGSTDGTRELLSSLPSVLMVDWPDSEGAPTPFVTRQLGAWADAVARADARWLAFIDPDEYLFSPRYRSLPTVLRAYEQHDAVAVCGLIFGTGGMATPQPSTIRAYTRRAAAGDPHVKSIVQLARVRPKPLTPHHFDCATVDERYCPVHGPYATALTFEHLRINHYFTRSVEEVQAKMRRPVRRSGLLGPALNAEFDTTILPYAELVEARLRAMAN